MKTFALALLPALALSACAGQADGRPAPASGVHEAQVHLGQTERIGGLRVKPLRVISDSRCPQGVKCVWAGTVQLALTIDGKPREITLHQSLEIDGKRLSLDEVSPAPVHQKPFPASAYRFSFSLR